MHVQYFEAYSTYRSKCSQPAKNCTLFAFIATSLTLLTSITSSCHTATSTLSNALALKGLTQGLYNESVIFQYRSLHILN